MRWVGFAICALVGLTLQSALGPRLAVGSVRPDWLLVIVVVFALFARMPDAAIGAWLLGAAAELMTLERHGLLSLSYLGAALLVASCREWLFRYRASTQFLVTLVVSLLIRLTWVAYQHLLYSLGSGLLWDCLTQGVLGSLYTAAWAPLIVRGFLLIPSWLGLSRPRYSFAGVPRMERKRV